MTADMKKLKFFIFQLNMSVLLRQTLFSGINLTTMSGFLFPPAGIYAKERNKERKTKKLFDTEIKSGIFLALKKVECLWVKGKMKVGRDFGG